ncbi:hypothetical protein JCM8547_007370 [Rhodosporidiobolus lusitaniae]
MLSTASPPLSAFPSSSPFLSLSSLSYAPPHRPSTLSTSFYPSLVFSPSWLARTCLLQTLGESLDDDDAGGMMWGGNANGHRVVRDAYGSTGCVNAMAWQEEGNLEKLATGGDDTKICIWKPGLDRGLFSDGRKAKAPGLQYGLDAVIDTGHTANIFSVKWAPRNENRLFSCAGDSTVRVYDLSLATNPKLSINAVTPTAPHRPFSFYENKTACTQVFRCHTDRVKRISTETSPDVFLTCSEDGTVRQHDLRTHHVCRSTRFGRQPDAKCPPPLAAYPGLSLYSLTISKLRPHLFVVAGTSPYAFLHDRRMLPPSSFRTAWGSSTPLPSPSSTSLTSCVRRFGVPDPSAPHAGDIKNQIVATKLSPTKPNELLVSYSERGVYLFDTDGEEHARPDPPPRVENSSDEEMDEEMRTGGEEGGGRKRARDEGVNWSDEEVDEEEVAQALAEDEEEQEGTGPTSREEGLRMRSGVMEEFMPGLIAAAAEDRARRERQAEEAAAAYAAASSLTPSLPSSPSSSPVSGLPPPPPDVPDLTSEEVTLALASGEELRDLEIEAAEAPSAGHEAEVEDSEMASVEEGEEEGEEEEESGISSWQNEDEQLLGDEEEEEEEGDSEEVDYDGPFPTTRRRAHNHNVPLIAPLKHYTGHANSQTVKDVNWGHGGTTVLSGSDDGNFFVWDKETEEVLAIFKGDSSVVNVLQPHPRLPLLAISGIDSEVKLFGPSTDKSKTAVENLVKAGKKEEIVRRNERGEGRARLGMNPSTLLAMLASRLRDEGVDLPGAEGTAGEGEGEEGGDGGAGRRTRRVQIRIGGEGGEVQDCAVM